MQSCRFLKPCVKNEEYIFESEYTAELGKEMNGFFLSQYNIINSITDEMVTHNIGATFMHVSRQDTTNSYYNPVISLADISSQGFSLL